MLPRPLRGSRRLTARRIADPKKALAEQRRVNGAKSRGPVTHGLSATIVRDPEA